MDDREWMHTGRSSQGLLTYEWTEKTDAFLELEFAKVKGEHATWCPCSSCANMRRQKRWSWVNIFARMDSRQTKPVASTMVKLIV